MLVERLDRNERTSEFAANLLIGSLGKIGGKYYQGCYAVVLIHFHFLDALRLFVCCNRIVFNGLLQYTLLLFFWFAIDGT